MYFCVILCKTTGILHERSDQEMRIHMNIRVVEDIVEHDPSFEEFDFQFVLCLLI